MAKYKGMKKLSYEQYWMKKGSYGETRIARMLTRKLKRHDKRANRVRFGLKRMHGKLYQLCDYQPNYGGTWCEYPCSGDC